MPGWHARTRDLADQEKVAIVGIAPEQHGDRMALFLQWKEMEAMPVMLDSYNLLGLKAVPITLLIDEAGVVRHRNPKPKELEEFLALPSAEGDDAQRAPRPAARVAGIELENPTAEGNRHAAKLRELEQLVAGQPEDAEARFQLGVAYRKRHDSPQRMDNDFAAAVKHWLAALELDPSNYIWRRRLQQYGPRLDKPYAFYDWVTQARREIRERGEKPHPLAAEPLGAELARPLGRNKEDPEAAPPHPDPDGKLPRDLRSVVGLETVVVPHTTKPRDAIRVILTLAPEGRAHQAKWNDEGGASTVHVRPPTGWVADPPVVTLRPPAGSKWPLREARTVDFELRRTDEEGKRSDGSVTRLDLFYHVCHGKEQVCQYLRRDTSVKLPARP